MNFLNKKTFIIAEAGVNHNGSLWLAKQLVDAAALAGVDAIKFQTFHADELVCVTAPKAAYQTKTTATDESQYDMLKALELTENDQIDLQAYCKKQNILFLSSPFDIKSVNFLYHQLQVPIFKIPSGEITHFPLLLHLAQTNQPVILSTGMSTLGEIENALAVLAYGYLQLANKIPVSLQACNEAYFSEAGQAILKDKVALLHCTTEYPAPFAEANLHVMNTLHQAFNLPIGYSDHTLGLAVSIAAVALGACIIEKHFTLDKTMPGPDHQASIEPDQLILLVQNIRQVELALGKNKKLPTPSELKNRLIARKSMVAANKIVQGDILNSQNIICKRPASGLSPTHFWEKMNKPAERDYEKDEFI